MSIGSWTSPPFIGGFTDLFENELERSELFHSYPSEGSAGHVLNPLNDSSSDDAFDNAETHCFNPETAIFAVDPNGLEYELEKTVLKDPFDHVSNPPDDSSLNDALHRSRETIYSFLSNSETDPNCSSSSSSSCCPEPLFSDACVDLIMNRPSCEEFIALAMDDEQGAQVRRPQPERPPEEINPIPSDTTKDDYDCFPILASSPVPISPPWAKRFDLLSRYLAGLLPETKPDFVPEDTWNNLLTLQKKGTLITVTVNLTDTPPTAAVKMPIAFYEIIYSQVLHASQKPPARSNIDHFFMNPKFLCATVETRPTQILLTWAFPKKLKIQPYFQKLMERYPDGYGTACKALRFALQCFHRRLAEDFELHDKRTAQQSIMKITDETCAAWNNVEFQIPSPFHFSSTSSSSSSSSSEVMAELLCPEKTVSLVTTSSCPHYPERSFSAVILTPEICLRSKRPRYAEISFSAAVREDYYCFSALVSSPVSASAAWKKRFNLVSRYLAGVLPETKPKFVPKDTWDNLLEQQRQDTLIEINLRSDNSASHPTVTIKMPYSFCQIIYSHALDGHSKPETGKNINRFFTESTLLNATTQNLQITHITPQTPVQISCAFPKKLKSHLFFRELMEKDQEGYSAAGKALRNELQRFYHHLADHCDSARALKKTVQQHLIEETNATCAIWDEILRLNGASSRPNLSDFTEEGTNETASQSFPSLKRKCPLLPSEAVKK